MGQHNYGGLGLVAVVALGVEALSLENRCSACEELVEDIGDPLVRFGLFRRGVTVSRRDRSESDELGEFGDRLQQRTALRAEIADELGRLSRNMEARSAGFAFVVGHHAPFDRLYDTGYMKRMSRDAILERVSSSEVPTWSFLTNHARVLLCVAQDPGVRLREIGDRVGITERAAHRIVDELVDAGYISRTRIGRRNHYAVHRTQLLADSLVREQSVGDLLALLTARGRE